MSFMSELKKQFRAVEVYEKERGDTLKRLAVRTYDELALEASRGAIPIQAVWEVASDLTNAAAAHENLAYLSGEQAKALNSKAAELERLAKKLERGR